MSKVVDERVVEMRFDNQQFERNVQTSMSTLDKLKQKLNLRGASKGLDELNTSAKRVDMTGLGRGVEAVSAKFSALQVMGVTALANLTNSAVNAGKNIVSALTIDPVKDGLAEYETQINAVQTILANTQKEGTNVKQVNAALDELNHYADKTIYNFTEMTRNIGTFTAAGVKLDTSVNAIQGIANLAAVSGSTSQQASTAMYQLSQALAAGTVKLMDWNSVVNAGMGGQVFQDALTETSEKLQTGAKSAIEAEGSFRESLKTGWLTSEVLTETLKKFTTSGATEYVAEYTGLSKEAVEATLEETDAWGDNADAIDKAAEALAKKSGKSKEEIANTLQFAKTAEDAATKVKTFSQLIDTLKEALGSGWTETWRLIIGDFEEAKELWTGVSDVLGGFINNMSDARNALLESALGKGFSGLSDKLTKMIEPAKKVTETIDKTVESVSNFDEIVNNVIRGDYGNGQDRFDALTEAGENYYRVQNKVNELLGCSKRYTDEEIDAQDKLLGKTNEETEATTELTDEKKNLIKKIASMTEEQMKASGYTDEQIAAFKELGETADKLGIPLDEFIDHMDEINGRWLLINSFKNIGNSLINVFSSIGTAWRSIFDPMSADTLFNIIAAFHKFTATIKEFTENNADNLTRTFKGLFAALDIVRTILGGGLSFAFKAINAVLKAFDTNILEVTAKIGDAIVAFRDFLFSNNLITKGFELLGQGAKMAVEAIGELVDKIKNIPKVQEFLEGLKSIDFSAILDGLINGLKSIDLVEIGHNIIEGLKNGLGDGIGSIPGILIEIGRSILDAIKGVLGIHSPSTEMHEVGKNAIEGLVNGLKEGISKVLEIAKDIGSKLLNFMKNVDWGKVFAVGSILATVAVLWKLSKAIENFSKPFASLGGVFDSVSGFIKTLSTDIGKVLKAETMKIKAEALKDLAVSLLILAGAVYILAQLDVTQLAKGVGVIIILSGVLIGLSFAMNKLNNASASIDKSGFKFDGLKTGLIGLGTAILLIAAAVKLMGGMDTDQAIRGFAGLAGIVVAISAVFLAFGTFVKGKSAQNIDKAGKMIKKMAVAMLLLVAVVKLVGMLSTGEMLKGAAFAAAFVVFVAALSKITSTAGKSVDKLGGMMIKMAFAMGLMVGVCKLAGSLSASEMLKGAAFAAGFVIFVKYLVKAVSVNKGTEIAKLSGLLLSISFSMSMMVGVCKLVGMLSAEEMFKGAAFMAGFIVFLKALIKFVKMDSGSQIAKISGLLLSVSVALALLVGVCKLVSLLSPGELLKGAVAIAAFGAMITAMVRIMKDIRPYATKMTSTILAISVAIGIMAAVCVLLSMVDVASLAKGIIAMGMLSAMMTAMIWATKGANNCMKNLIVLTAAIGVLAGAVALLSMLDTKKLAGATACLSVLMGMFAIMAKASSSATGALAGMAAVTLVVAALAGILYLLGGLPIQAAISSSAALSILMLSLAAAVNIIGNVRSVATSALVAVGVMTAVVAALAVVLYCLRDLPVNSTLANAAALSTLLIALSTSALILSKVGPMASGSIAGAAGLMLMLGGVAVVFSAVAGLIGLIPGVQEFLDNGIVVLEKLGYGLGAFFGNIIGGFTAGATAGLPEIAENLKTFMNTFTGIDTSAIDGVKALTDVILEISAASILDGISKFINFGQSPMEQFADQIVVFGEAMKALSSTISGLSGTDIYNIETITKLGEGLAALQSLVEPAYGLKQVLVGEKNLGDFGAQVATYATNINQAANAVSSISFSGIVNLELLATLGTAFAKLQSTVAPANGLLQVLQGSQDLGTFGSQVAAYASNMNQAANAVATISADGLTNLESIANIGQAFTALQKTVTPCYGLVQVLQGTQDLGAFGTQVSTYASNMNTAANAVATISADGLTNLESIANIGQAFTALQKTVTPCYGLVQVLQGTQDLGAFGTQVSTYASNMNTAANAVATISVEGLANLESIAGIGHAFTELQKTVEPVNGLIQAIKGSTDLGSFGTSISTYASGLSEASKALTGENAINEEAISAAVNAGRLIASLQKALPEEHWFDGKMNLTDFKTRIVDFGSAMGSFGESVGTIDEGKINSAISAGRRIATFATSIVDLDTSGIAKFSADGWGSHGIADIGEAIGKFSEKVADVDTAVVSKSITAANRLKTFVNGLTGFDNSGIENFKVDGVGKKLKSYSNAVAEVNVSNVSKSITAANRLKSFVTSLSGFDNSGISKFNVSALGTKLKSYADSAAGVNAGTIASSVTGAQKLASFISSLSGLDTSGVGKFKSAVDSLGQTNVGNITKAFSGASSKLSSAGMNMMSSLAKGMSSGANSLKSTTSSMMSSAVSSITGKSSAFSTAGSQLGAKLASGISSKRGAVITAANGLATAAANATRGGFSTAYSAGTNLGAGYVSGVNAKVSAAYQAGYAVGSAGARGINDGQHSNSPSKLAIQSGKWLGEGYQIGIEAMAKSVHKTSTSLGEEGTNSISSAISKMSSMIDTDMDSTPTIRPVVDMTNVEAQAKSIGTLFSNPMITPGSNIRAINAMMKEQSQNGQNDDVVYAINKLRKDLGNVGNTYNSINGVTYDNGSEISAAVETLIRAAQVERRR